MGWGWIYLIWRSYFLLFSDISGDLGDKPVKLILKGSLLNNY